MSPAGYWPQLHAAIGAGADAVYFGLDHFSARAKVGFTLEELPEVIRTLHSRGVRGYLTFNTLVFENELAEAARTIEAIAQAGTDALIIQDLGVLRLARKIAPEIELHASTQMSITDAEGVRFAQRAGANRVTLARELSLKEVASIYQQTGCDLEMFVHGALCVAYSGQCFSSEAWGGRSANRGQCAQACRLPYDLIVDDEQKPLGDARYLLSPGDLYTLKEVPEIVKTGVACLKIEGRYKDVEYVTLTTAAYRKAVDEAWAGLPLSVTAAEELDLEQVYSRGLGPYFVTGTNHQKVVSGRAPRHRGVLMGRVAQVNAESVIVAVEDKPDRIAPLKEGDGLVFDAADWRSPGEPEEGGRVYEAARAGKGKIELRFGNGAVRFHRIRPGDLVWRTDRPELSHSVHRLADYKQTVSVAVTAREGLPLRTEWRVKDCVVTVESAGVVTAARNRQMRVEGLREQFERLGNTPYELGSLSAGIEGKLFCPVSMLNQIRREAVEQLQARQGSVPPVRITDAAAALQELRHVSPVVVDGEPHLHLLVRTPEQLEAALNCDPASITLDYLDLYGLRPSVQRVKASGIMARVASPRVLKQEEARILNFLLSLECQILVRSTGILQALRDKPHPELIGDFSLNAANSLTVAGYLEQGLVRLTPTHDLNAAQVAQLGSDRIEAVAYQHLPVFHTEHCVFCRFLSAGTSYKDCGRPCEKHRVELRDHTGRSHPVMADVGCRNTVFGAEAQEASAHLELWLDARIRHFRLEFVHESGAQVKAVTRAFQNALTKKNNFAQLTRELKAISPAGTTQGSLLVSIRY